MSEEGTLKNIPLSQIEEGSVALRPAQKTSEQYLGIVESIRSKGFDGAILVRPLKTEDGSEKFEIIDGTQRFNACKDLGLESINAVVKDMDKETVLATQLMMNFHRVHTTPIQYTKQLQAMISLKPTLTLDNLARDLGVSTTFINNRLSLLKLHEDIQPLVDSNKITLSNAQYLSKLPVEEQVSFVDQAMTATPSEFGPIIKERLDEIRKAKNSGEKPEERKFTPSAKLRKMKEIEPLLDNQAAVRELISEISDPLEAAVFMLNYCVNLDEASVKEQEAKWHEREATKQEAAEKRKIERLEQKEKEAADERAKLEAKQAAAS